MITIVTALYQEAKPFIHTLQLKKDTSETKYQLFRSEEACLLITGAGMLSSCAAISRHFSLHPATEGDLLASIGIAGSLSKEVTPGSLFLAAKLTETSTMHTFYPDMLYKNSFAKAKVLTVSRPLTDAKESSELLIENSVSTYPTLVDMEASAIYQTALPYLSPDRMFFFKSVSDLIPETTASGEISQIDPEAFLAPHTATILSYLRLISQVLHSENSSTSISFTQAERDAITAFSEHIPLTSAMQQDFSHLLRYLKLNQVELQPLLADFLATLPLEPLHGKKQAMPWLKKFRKQAVEAAAALQNSTDFLSASSVSAYLPPFSTLYVEEELARQPGFQSSTLYQNLSTRTHCDTVLIHHYKDVFNRGHQNFARQKKAPSLILSEKSGTLIYPGAPVCQSFGNEHFYYTSNCMNCIYHCDYCYLQGMYPSGHIVVFVNLADYFAEIEQLLTKHPVYLCISYDTDLLALEPLLHYVEQWIAFSIGHPDLTIEIRTKSGNPILFSHFKDCLASQPVNVCKRIIFAWTLSPDCLAKVAEAGAASPALRLKAAKAAHDAGFPVRLCFDPMIYFSGWETAYRELITQVFSVFQPQELLDISIGVFRIGTDYLKIMRKKRPDSPLVWFPYISENGVSHYGTLSEEMVQYLYQLLSARLSKQQLFIWDGNSVKDDAETETNREETE